MLIFLLFISVYHLLNPQTYLVFQVHQNMYKSVQTTPSPALTSSFSLKNDNVSLGLCNINCSSYLVANDLTTTINFRLQLTTSLICQAWWCEVWYFKAEKVKLEIIRTGVSGGRS